MTHYFDADPVVASERRSVALVLPDVALTLATDRGVFARDAVDAGTRLLLLEGPSPPSTGHVVDLGCGYGPIALALAARAPGATVWAVDVNRRALDLTAANAEVAGLVNVRAVAPEEVPTDLVVDGLWSNPPIRIGKPALHGLLAAWLARLAGGASACLVVHKHLGADSLARWLEAEGYSTARRASRMGYRLLDVAARTSA